MRMMSFTPDSHPAVARRAPEGDVWRRGFTLVELLVVLAILALMVAIVTPQVMKYLGRARTDTAQIELRNLSTALDLFMIDVGRYPTQEEGLDALVVNSSRSPKWHGPYLKATSVPLDPWGHPYLYKSPGKDGDYDLYTLGSEGQADSPSKP